ncbi:hypothetical protein [Fodinicola feengrottensis]|uniref:hypothetical protein n=1 Tax=Fodinicola feengrottensis TaxID=435914 RepID=UPI0013D4B33F|nr:hypothetical protein [Fodinicola feengrottensis]
MHVLLLVDLAAGEPLGQDRLGGAGPAHPSPGHHLRASPRATPTRREERENDESRDQDKQRQGDRRAEQGQRSEPPRGRRHQDPTVLAQLRTKA